MSELISHNKIKKPTPKSFGIVFSIVFLLISLYPLINSEGVRLWSIIISAFLLIIAFGAPKLLNVFNDIWFRFGILLGSIIAPIFMALIYFFTIVPTGVIMRLLGKDLLQKKLDKNVKSYWITRDEPVGSMNNQF